MQMLLVLKTFAVAAFADAASGLCSCLLFLYVLVCVMYADAACVVDVCCCCLCRCCVCSCLLVTTDVCGFVAPTSLAILRLKITSFFVCIFCR